MYIMPDIAFQFTIVKFICSIHTVCSTNNRTFDNHLNAVSFDSAQMQFTVSGCVGVQWFVLLMHRDDMAR